MGKSKRTVNVRYLIHNWLYESLDVANQFRDEKDRPSKVWCLLDEKERKQTELNADYVSGIFENEQEAKEELESQ